MQAMLETHSQERLGSRAMWVRQGSVVKTETMEKCNLAKQGWRDLWGSKAKLGWRAPRSSERRD
jgi:hypothetical protein